MIIKFFIRSYIIFLRKVYLFKIFYCLFFNKKLSELRGSYNSLQEAPDRIKLLEDKLCEQIDKFKKNYKKRKFIYLEIGSYTGSSLVVAGETLKKKLNDNFIIFSVDPYTAYADKDEKEFSIHELSKSIGKIYFYFLYNISLYSWKNNHIHLRKTSHEAKSFFSDNNFFFDFVYIDGSHYYKDIKKDTENYYDLIQIRKGYRGFFCGDDLEFSYKDLLSKNLFNEKKVNKLIKDNLTNDQIKFKGEYFHPGVTKALHEFSKKYKKKVHNEKGFWYLS